MVVRVTGLRDTVGKLRNYRQRLTEAVKEGIEEGAQIIAEEAKDLVPVLTQNLEDSIDWAVNKETEDEYEVVIFFDGRRNGFNYGEWIHEGVYNLGKESLEKQARVGKVVGRKFLSRAIANKKQEVINLVKQKTKEARVR